ncbi:RimK/LysX family protein [Stappia sp. ES.058]|uniref:ATP-dependent zinc protease family protein n=1 Tax=Stappia sp. ES.058 TaxID=1881061 RepID=UPI00087AD71A|nr:RimK/LysX family protein [Stappia sp. ES.058]SDU06827.1 Uncharacterized conserved protein [Stappia sp. ES.058]
MTVVSRQRRSDRAGENRKAGRKKPVDIIGWREWVALPDIGIPEIKAKIDTGARTSALHAVNQDVFEREGRPWVRFKVPASNKHRDIPVEAPLIDERDIKNTSGIPERRYIIRTTLLLGEHHWKVDVSLANREHMEFDIILGRTAIRSRSVLVHPGKSFVAGPPRQHASTGRVIPRAGLPGDTQ